MRGGGGGSGGLGQTLIQGLGYWDGKLGTFSIDLRRPWTRAFFQPTPRTVDFSLRLKNSDHVITFSVALRF